MTILGYVLYSVVAQNIIESENNITSNVVSEESIVVKDNSNKEVIVQEKIDYNFILMYLNFH